MLIPPRNTEHETYSSADRLAGLEILRFLCAASVLLWHYQVFWFFRSKAVHFERTAQPFYSVLWPFYEHGFEAVLYFWSISGFIFFFRYDRFIPTKIGAYKFFVLRFSRLYPLHLATLFTVAILQFAYLRRNGNYFTYVDNTFKNFILNLFMVANLDFPNSSSFNGPIWSVSVEIIAYISFYLVCSQTKLAQMTAVIASIFFAFLYATNERYNPILACLTFFYMGGGLSVIYRFARRLKATNLTFCLSGLAYIIYLFLGDRMQIDELIRNLILIPFPILCAVCLPFSQNALVQKISKLGNLTYSTYLLHFPATLAIVLIVPLEIASIRTTSVFFFAFYGILLLVSWLCYQRFEMPVQGMLRRFMISSDKGSSFSRENEATP
jgi:peptidoglycan/LPS O-acetylase OafA/YrhL